MHQTEATSEIPYLKPGQWLGNNTIDRYLLQHWLKRQDESPVLYLNTYHIILCSHFNTPSSQEYKTVQRSLLLPENSVVPLRPVAFVIYNHETRHYFTVVINYKLHHITQLSAIPSTHQPNCRLTGHDSNPTVSRPISLPTQLLADWSPLQHTLSANWLSLQPDCWLPH